MTWLTTESLENKNNDVKDMLKTMKKLIKDCLPNITITLLCELVPRFTHGLAAIDQ